jgi:hypothetical protein
MSGPLSDKVSPSASENPESVREEDSDMKDVEIAPETTDPSGSEGREITPVSLSVLSSLVQYSDLSFSKLTDSDDMVCFNHLLILHPPYHELGCGC